MVAEFAAGEEGGDKAAWIKDIPGYLKTSMRDIDAIIWFDIKKETDWRINSSAKSLAAFKEIMKDQIFAGTGNTLATYTQKPGKPTKKLATAFKATQQIKVDGNINEWNKTSPIAMKDISFLKEGLIWKGPADLSGDIYLMWDEANFYLAALVDDVIPMVNTKENQDIWDGDAIEMVFSLNSAADPKRDSFGKGDYQIGFGTGDGRANKPTIWNWQRRRVPAGSEIVTKKIDGKGYIIEAKIPWSFFGNGFMPAVGSKIGFDVALDDADSTGEREKQFIWNGDFYFYKDPSVWGTLEFN
jgi:hypothetical protein